MESVTLTLVPNPQVVRIVGVIPPLLAHGYLTVPEAAQVIDDAMETFGFEVLR